MPLPDNSNQVGSALAPAGSVMRRSPIGAQLRRPCLACRPHSKLSPFYRGSACLLPCMQIAASVAAMQALQGGPTSSPQTSFEHTTPEAQCCSFRLTVRAAVAQASAAAACIQPDVHADTSTAKTAVYAEPHSPRSFARTISAAQLQKTRMRVAIRAVGSKRPTTSTREAGVRPLA
jgi:hypothetical protein